MPVSFVLGPCIQMWLIKILSRGCRKQSHIQEEGVGWEIRILPVVQQQTVKSVSDMPDI